MLIKEKNFFIYNDFRFDKECRQYKVFCFFNRKKQQNKIINSNLIKIKWSRLQPMKMQRNFLLFQNKMIILIDFYLLLLINKFIV